MGKKVDPGDLLKNELAQSAFFNKSTSITSKEEVKENEASASVGEEVIHSLPLEDHLIMPEPLPTGLVKRKNLNSITLTILKAPTSLIKNTPVRLPPDEMKYIKDFLDRLRLKKGVGPRSMSLNKLMRICTRYMIEVNEAELSLVIARAIKSKDDLNF